MERERFTQEQWTAIWALVGAKLHPDELADGEYGSHTERITVLLTDAIRTVLGLEHHFRIQGKMAEVTFDDGDDAYVFGMDADGWYWGSPESE